MGGPTLAAEEIDKGGLTVHEVEAMAMRLAIAQARIEGMERAAVMAVMAVEMAGIGVSGHQIAAAIRAEINTLTRRVE